MNTDENKYNIEFIDPDDLVGFIEESKEIEVNPPESESIPTDQLLEENIPNPPESDLKYTELIKETSSDYIQKRREDTRGRLALAYTICTFIIFIVVIGVAVLDGILRRSSIIENLTTLLPLVSGIFLGTLGFVLGYYFKNGEDR